MRLPGLSAVAVLAIGVAIVAQGPSHAVRAAAVPGTTCSVFPADNIWNTDISNLPVNASSATWLSSTGGSSGRLLHPDFGGPPYGIPFNVASNSTLTYSFNFLSASESDAGPYPVPAGALIEAPTDSHMLVINKDSCKLYETFATHLNTSPYSAGSGAIFDLNSNQLRQADWTSADAAGLPIFPGLVRLDEVQAGFIGHAIRFTTHNTNDTYIWPARHHAGTNDPTLPPMGARFRLKNSYDISSFGAATQVVLTAFKHYGLIDADNGSDWFFQGTEDTGWNNAPYDTMVAQLKTVPASAFEAVDESALMINPDSAQAGTVPAAASAPTAAPRAAGATVTWSAPASGGPPITSYTVTGNPSGQAVVAGGLTTAVVYGLTNGTSYTFRVTANNVVGAGPPSPPSNSIAPNGRLSAQGPSTAPPGRQPVLPSTSTAHPRVPVRAPQPTPPAPQAPAWTWPGAAARIYVFRI